MSDLVGGSVELQTSRTMPSSVVCSRPSPAPGCLRGRDACARGSTPKKVGRQDRWTVDRDVTHNGVARRLSVLLSLPIGRRITREPPLEDGRGAPLGPNPFSTAEVHYRLLSLFVGASSTTEGLECQARQRWTQSNRWSRRSPLPV